MLDMKIKLAFIGIIILAMANTVLSYNVENMEDCLAAKWESKEIVGTPRSVIVGESAFLTLVTENGEELILLPENGEGIQFFRENEGKKAHITFHK